MKTFLIDSVLALIVVALFLLVAGEMQDREGHIEDMRRAEVVSQIQAAVERIAK